MNEATATDWNYGDPMPTVTNPSGINPMEFNVLVKQDEVKRQTAGGLHIPDDLMDREKHAATKGTIIALSPMAFTEDIWPPGMRKPPPGTRILMVKHSGIFAKGEDGEEYRIIKDKDIVAMLEKTDG